MTPKNPKFDDLEEMRKDLDALSELVDPGAAPGHQAKGAGSKRKPPRLHQAGIRRPGKGDGAGGGGSNPA